MRRDIAAAGDEAAIDHRLELPGDRKRRERRDAERDRRDDDLERIAARIAPDHPQAAALAGTRPRGLGGRGFLVGCGRHRARSEERRGGKECVSTCRSRGAAYSKKKNKKRK